MNWLKRIFHVGPVTEKVPLTFFNTLSKSAMEFALADRASVTRVYCCGPTVYDRQHIGNLSKALPDHTRGPVAHSSPTSGMKQSLKDVQKRYQAESNPDQSKGHGHGIQRRERLAQVA